MGGAFFWQTASASLPVVISTAEGLDVVGDL